MDEYVLIISVIGLAALAMAWMPAITAKTGISYSIIYVAFGAILYAVLNLWPQLNHVRRWKQVPQKRPSPRVPSRD